VYSDAIDSSDSNSHLRGDPFPINSLRWKSPNQFFVESPATNFGSLQPSVNQSAASASEPGILERFSALGFWKAPGEHDTPCRLRCQAASRSAATSGPAHGAR
jgi:hypothetical protein